MNFIRIRITILLYKHFPSEYCIHKRNKFDKNKLYNEGREEPCIDLEINVITEYDENLIIFHISIYYCI